MFHLFTHAFFKALLFLAAGSVMHAMGNVIDMRRFSGLRKVLPITHWTFLCGAAGPGRLPAAVRLLEQGRDPRRRLRRRRISPHYGGVYLVAVHRRPGHGGPDGVLHLPGLLPDLLGRGTHPRGGRRPRPRVAAGDDRAADDPGRRSRSASASSLGRCTHWFSHVRSSSWIDAHARHRRRRRRRAPRTGLLMGVSSVWSPLAGIGLACWMYVAQPGLPAQAGRARRRACTSCRCNKFYVDELYDVFIVKPLDGFAAVLPHRSISTSSTAWWTWSGRCRAVWACCSGRCRTGWCSSTPWLMVLGLTVFLLALVRCL